MTVKVLTVDDSKTIRSIVKKAFSGFDCQMYEGENGVEGLAVASKERPDLIVLDITMPVMNGIETLEKLKGEPTLKDIPVIMLTAESGKDNVMQIVKMGVKDYMVKPFKGEELLQRANKIIKLEPRKEGNSAADPFQKLFSSDGDIQILRLPSHIDKDMIARIKDYFTSGMEKGGDSGTNKLILDLSKLGEVNVSLIKLIILALEKCQQTKTRLRILGSSKLSNELKGFQETSELTVYQTLDEAKAAF